MLPSNKTVRWIENLAAQEKLVCQGEQSSVDLTHTKEEVLDIETTAFVREVHTHLDYLLNLFNQKVESPLKIQLLWNSEKQDSFSLIRGEFEMTLLKSKPAAVQVQCGRGAGRSVGSYAKKTILFSSIIEGSYGIFHDVVWRFLGNEVVSEQLAKHYLTEFIQISRDKKESYSTW